VLQQCTGIVVRLNIHFEITCSTTVVEFNNTMSLVVLMERCNLIGASTETIHYRNNGTFHFIRLFIEGFRTYILKRASWSRWLGSYTVKLIIGGSRPTEVLAKETFR